MELLVAAVAVVVEEVWLPLVLPKLAFVALAAALGCSWLAAVVEPLAAVVAAGR